MKYLQLLVVAVFAIAPPLVAPDVPVEPAPLPPMDPVAPAARAAPMAPERPRVARRPDPKAPPGTQVAPAARSTVAPAPPPPPPPAAPQEPTRSVWDRLAQCESGGDWSINTGNGYYGGVQFSLRSWQWVGGSGYPHQASKAEQIKRAEKLLALQGWKAWPACSLKLGLRK